MSLEILQHYTYIHTYRLTYIHKYIYIVLSISMNTEMEKNIYISKVNDRSEGRAEALFSIATTPRYRRGCVSFSWFAPL